MATSLSKEFEKKLLEAARKKAKELSIEASESLKKEYMKIIKEFYMEEVFRSDSGGYTNYPRYYDRNFNYVYSDRSILISGLGHTFKSFTSTSKSKNTYIGGIRISTKYMTGEHYHGTYDMVLSSFLRGWHGLPSEDYGGIPVRFISGFNTPIGQDGSIWNYINRYKKELRKELADRFIVEVG